MTLSLFGASYLDHSVDRLQKLCQIKYKNLGKTLELCSRLCYLRDWLKTIRYWKTHSKGSRFHSIAWLIRGEAAT